MKKMKSKGKMKVSPRKAMAMGKKPAQGMSKDYKKKKNKSSY